MPSKLLISREEQSIEVIISHELTITESLMKIQRSFLEETL